MSCYYFLCSFPDTTSAIMNFFIDIIEKIGLLTPLQAAFILGASFVLWTFAVFLIEWGKAIFRFIVRND